MNNKSIIVDLDGTLANIDHRLHFVESAPKNWRAFFDAMIADSLNQWCADLIKIHKQAGVRIYLFSGRPDSHRRQTEWWLNKHDVPYDELHMRREGDFRPDTIIKREMLLNVLPVSLEEKSILYAIDDRQSVVDMWRAEGLTCLQCNQWTE